MTRIRTTPVTKETVAKDIVYRFGVEMAYDADGSPNPTGAKFIYTVKNLDPNGKTIQSHQVTYDFSQWPAALKRDLKAVYNKVLSDAENKGFIGSGTDVEDMP